MVNMRNWCQNKNVAKTSGGSKIFEDRMTATSEIVKNRWKYVTCLTTQNPHVRESIGIMQRAERCKIEEIWLKSELLKSIWKMKHSWPIGAETVCLISAFFGPPFGEPVWRTLSPTFGAFSCLRRRWLAVWLELWHFFQPSALFLAFGAEVPFGSSVLFPAFYVGSSRRSFKPCRRRWIQTS